MCDKKQSIETYFPLYQDAQSLYVRFIEMDLSYNDVKFGKFKSH